jgi:dihydrofolate reductase
MVVTDMEPSLARLAPARIQPERNSPMGTVIFDTSMSLDGFMTTADPTLAQPLGRGGESLHAWVVDEDPVNRDYLNNAIGHLGAVVCGRRTYDTSISGWRADGPSGPLRVPVFVVTHQAPETSPRDSVYTFVTDSIESALRQAVTAAGERDVTVMGGADLGQYLTAGLLTRSPSTSFPSS